QLAVGTCEIVMLNRDSSQPKRTIARQTARCACRRGQIAGTTRARPACVDARIVKSRQWCEMSPCSEGEICGLLFNYTGWTCTKGGGRIKTVTSSLQDGGNDITDGRNKEGTCGAEDDEKCAEKQGGDGLMECEEQNDDDDELTDRRRSEDGAGAAEEHGKCSEASEERVRSDPLRKDISTNMPQQIKMEEKRGVSTAVGEAQGAPANADERTDEDSATETRLCAQSQTGNEQSSGHLETGDSEYQQSSAKPKCCKRINFPAAQSPSDVNDRQDKIEVKGQVGELDGEVTDTNNGDRVLQDAGENSDVDDPKSNGGDPSSSCESDVEIVDVLDSSGSAGIRSSASKVENFLEKCENLKRIINEYVHSQGSPFTRLKRDDVAMETGANRDVAKGEFKVEMNSEPICQAKNSNRDVEIIEVVDDDDEDEETLVDANDVNGNFPAFESPAQIKTGDAIKSSDKANAHKCDVEIADLRESRRDGAECQNLLEKIESRKRRVSDGNDETRSDAKAVTPAPMIQTEDPSPKRLKPADVQSAAEDLASSRSSEEPNPSIAPEEESESLLDCDGEDALMVQDNCFSPASFTDDPGPDVASSQSSGCFSELQISNVVSLTAPVELPESRASDSGVSNYSMHDEEVSHDLDYKVLKCEETINQIRAKLRGMEEKLDTLNC
ncbi:protein FAM19A5, partial [Silurus meridionalis]